jgi:hypothetical protein
MSMNNDEKDFLKTGVESVLRLFSDLMEKLFDRPAEEIGAARQRRRAIRESHRRDNHELPTIELNRWPPRHGLTLHNGTA